MNSPLPASTDRPTDTPSDRTSVTSNFTLLGAGLLLLGTLLAVGQALLGPAAEGRLAQFLELVAPSVDRLWSNMLIGTYGLVTLGLGGAVFLALTSLVGASWHVAFRRVPEALAGILPLSCFALFVILCARASLYGWEHDGHGGPGTFWFKEWWATPNFWIARAAIYMLLWVLMSRWLISLSRLQDTTGNWRLTISSKRVSALFLAIFAPTFTLASCDWLMLLEPLWFSTAWGTYQFAGMMEAALAVIVLLALSLRRNHGPLAKVFNDDHLHDLGKLLIGFSCFWMYLWFSQYMLIWYVNAPEEILYYLPRTEGAWGPLLVANLVLNWILPFMLLLPRPAKRSASLMTKIAFIVLAGRWLDLYRVVFPAVCRDSHGHALPPQFGVWEVATILFLGGLLIIRFRRHFNAAPPVPTADPLLSESLHYHC